MLLIAFTVLVAVTAAAVLVAGRSIRLGQVLRRLQDTTAEIRVRAAVLLLTGFIVLAAQSLVSWTETPPPIHGSARSSRGSGTAS